MKKAILKHRISIAELDSDNEILDEIIIFEEGIEVEVLCEASSKSQYKQYVIYNDRIGESTVVYEGFLDFIE